MYFVLFKYIKILIDLTNPTDDIIEELQVSATIWKSGKMSNLLLHRHLIKRQQHRERRGGRIPLYQYARCHD